MKKLKFERFYHQNILCFLGMTVLFCMLLFPACIKPSDGGSTTTPPKVNEWDTLPAITQIGANTMGCLLNDTVWVPHGVLLMGALKQVDFDEKDALGSGYMQFRLKEDTRDDFMGIGFDPTFFMSKEFAPGSSSAGEDFFRTSLRVGNKTYLLDLEEDSSSNYLSFTKIDTINNFVAGHFAFVLYKRTNGGPDIDKTDSVVISDGRFDMKYIPN